MARRPTTDAVISTNQYELLQQITSQRNKKIYKLPDETEPDYRELLDRRDMKGARVLWSDIMPRSGNRGDRVIWLPLQEAIVPDATRLEWTLNLHLPVVTDVKQRESQNCWNLSPLAALAHKWPEFVQSLVTQKMGRDKKNNLRAEYHVNLYKSGKPVTVVVTNEFACHANTRQLMYVTSPGKQMAIPIIVKALALAHSTYDATEFGGPREGFSIYTKYPYRQVFLDTNRDEAWHILQAYQQYPMATATKAVQDEARRVHLSANLGLVADHCYTVVRLLEIDGTRLVVLYNPWGRFGWSGAWADDDSVNWTDERKTRFEHGQSSKGTFHIPFDDFCEYFFYVDICMARPLVMIRDDWQISRFRARFPTNDSHNTNMSIVQFDVVTDSTSVEVILFQASRRTRSNHLIPEMPVCVCVYQVHVDCSLSFFGELVFFSGYAQDIYRRTDVVLKRGRYVVVPMGLSHWPVPATSDESSDELQKFILCLQSDKKIDAKGLNSSTVILAHALYSLVTDRCKPIQVQLNVDMYLLKRSEGWSGLVVLLVNKDPNHSVEFTFDPNQSRNLLSTRICPTNLVDLKTVDIIEPRTWQVITVLSPAACAPSAPFIVAYNEPICVRLDGRVSAKHEPALDQAELLHRSYPLPPRPN